MRDRSAQRRAWTAPRTLDLRCHPSPMREAFVHQYQEQLHFEKLASLSIEMDGSRFYGLIDDR